MIHLSLRPISSASPIKLKKKFLCRRIGTPNAMTLPLLVPRSSRPVAPAVPVPRAMPSQHDWAAAYPEIERLYVRERRKLRYTMQHMESEHGFTAT